MDGATKNCLHSEGLRAVVGFEFRCPVCEATLDLDGVARWVREAERARDEAYALLEGDQFGEIVCGERQREVYRRRRVMYELQNMPRVAAARPEMILVIYEAREDSYECRIFYKAPRPAWGVERFSVGARMENILELRSNADPAVRLASEKVEEFHALRHRLSEGGVPAPPRRVFYANEL